MIDLHTHILPDWDDGAADWETAERLLKLNLVHLIASDAHNAEERPPRLSEAVERAAKVVGKEKAEAMVMDVPAAILRDQEVPDFGDPIAPSRKKWLHFFNW